jgi:hypothetical protein
VTKAGHRLYYPAVEPEKAELYQLRTDEREQQNVAADNPEIVAQLREIADAYLAGPPPPWGEDGMSVEIDEMTLNQLRALGYKIDQ